jgi:hypothetical protein
MSKINKHVILHLIVSPHWFKLIEAIYVVCTAPSSYRLLPSTQKTNFSVLISSSFVPLYRLNPLGTRDKILESLVSGTKTKATVTSQYLTNTVQQATNSHNSD